MIELGPQAIPYIKSGRLKVLAVSTATRSEAMPEVPTIAESGVPGFYAFTWFALYAPAGTPKEIIERVHASMAKVFGEPAMKERLATIGAEVALTTPDGLAAFQASETAKWSAVIKRAGIRPE
jgi:tripartite-type tricarboxylate transporter receptor subunit TctC